jgi:outer membrane receptor protein involved in Fe transport
LLIGLSLWSRVAVFPKTCLSDASNFTAVTNLTARHPSGWFAALRARHFGESPLVEDNSARLPGYTTVDAQWGFQQSKGWQVAVEVFNLANVKWNDIEYYYVSRLRSEVTPQADHVVHPGVPRTFRARIQYQF